MNTAGSRSFRRNISTDVFCGALHPLRLIILFSLGIGILGYHHFGGLSWLDSLLNASVILTGMGPVNAMESEAGKLFASFYALFGGIAFLTVVAVFFAPIIHRFLHRFHLEAEEEESREKKR